MIERIISPGDKLDIEPLEAKEEHGIYRSRVLDVLKKDRLRIAMPFDGDRLVVMSLNESYKIYIYAESGLYECMAHVTERFKSNNLYIAILNLKTGLRRVQRREFFRLEKILDVEYRMLREEEVMSESAEIMAKLQEPVAELQEPVAESGAQSEEAVPYKKGVAVDLSGGGARFLLDKAYPINTHLLLKLYINTEEKESPFLVLGKVVMSEESPNKTNQYENRLEFVRIKETEREKLVQYIFQEERKQRKSRKS